MFVVTKMRLEAAIGCPVVIVHATYRGVCVQEEKKKKKFAFDFPDRVRAAIGTKSSHPQKYFSKFFLTPQILKCTHRTYAQNAHTERPHIERPQNAHRTPTERPQNAHRTPTERPQNAYRRRIQKTQKERRGYASNAHTEDAHRRRTQKEHTEDAYRRRT